MINQEEIYKWLKDGEYGKVIGLLHLQKDAIKSDPILTYSANVSITEILRVSKQEENPSADFIIDLERLDIIHEGKFFQMNDLQHKDLIATLIKFSNGDLKKAYRYAKRYPNEGFSQPIIEEFEKNTPKEIQHTQSDYIKLTFNNQIEEIDCRISLFKSKEEQKMFFAFKRIFDTYLIYPNVSLSNLIDFQKIKKRLSQNEQKYFFQASVDLVVFDPIKQYWPIYFFELDSVWHDEENALEKDRIKDNIFSLAGLKVFRIRDKKNKKIDEDEFEELVKEVRLIIENKEK